MSPKGLSNLLVDAVETAAVSLVGKIDPKKLTWNGVLADLPRISGLFEWAMRNRLLQLESGYVGALRIISYDKNLIIPPTGGGKTITQFPKIFQGYSDGEFCRVDRGQATSEIETEIYENTKCSIFLDLYNAFGLDLKLLGLTQEQVALWVKTNRRYLARKLRTTYFLLSTGLDVAAVHILNNGKIGVTHRPLYSRNRSIWSDRFVVRKIT